LRTATIADGYQGGRKNAYVDEIRTVSEVVRAQIKALIFLRQWRE